MVTPAQAAEGMADSIRKSMHACGCKHITPPPLNGCPPCDILTAALAAYEQAKGQGTACDSCGKPTGPDYELAMEIGEQADADHAEALERVTRERDELQRHQDATLTLARDIEQRWPHVRDDLTSQRDAALAALGVAQKEAGEMAVALRLVKLARTEGYTWKACEAMGFGHERLVHGVRMVRHKINAAVDAALSAYEQAKGQGTTCDGGFPDCGTDVRGWGKRRLCEKCFQTRRDLAASPIPAAQAVEAPAHAPTFKRTRIIPPRGTARVGFFSACSCGWVGAQAWSSKETAVRKAGAHVTAAIAGTPGKEP